MKPFALPVPVLAVAALVLAVSAARATSLGEVTAATGVSKTLAGSGASSARGTKERASRKVADATSKRDRNLAEAGGATPKKKGKGGASATSKRRGPSGPRAGNGSKSWASGGMAGKGKGKGGWAVVDENRARKRRN